MIYPRIDMQGAFCDPELSSCWKNLVISKNVSLFKLLYIASSKIKIIFSINTMKASPKVVAIDLAAESKRRSKSPTRTTSPKKTNQSLQFSFSHEHSPFLDRFTHNPNKDTVSKNLFGKIPEQRRQVPLKYQENSNTAFETRKSKGKQKEGLYKRRDRNDRLFKKSLDKLKKAFFNDVRSNRDRTVKTLKQIGKYAKSRAENAKSRSREEQLTAIQRSSSSRRKNIPVEFVGFDPNSTESRYKDRSSLSNVRLVQSKQASTVKEFIPSRVMADKGTYFNFQQQLQNQLKQKQSFPFQVETAIVNKGPPLRQPYQAVASKLVGGSSAGPQYSTSGLDEINQIEIDVVCQLFQMCQKYNQGDRLIVSEFIQLLKELQRLYFIKVIQQSQAGSSRSSLRVFESEFNQLLREFQETMRVVFYRKEACDIYDCLYYLKESGRLDKLCTLFLGIKNMLDL